MATPKPELPILAFPTAEAWEAWLAAQPDDCPGLWLKLPKQGCATPSVTKPQAIDGALRHGWIDGQIARLDADWFLTRFTPRKGASNWSQLNRSRAEALIAAGRMAPRGLAEVERARADGRWDAAYPAQSRAVVPADLAAALDAEPTAAALFAALDSANRYAVLYRVHQCKTAQARAKKIDQLVAMLARGETIHRRREPHAAG